MAKFEKKIIGDFHDIVNKLNDKIINSAATMNLVDESNYSIGNANIAVRVYDKYFMRNGNRASLSLTVVGHDSEIFISAVGAGGGQGIFFNFSLGAEDDMVYVVKSCIENLK